MNKNVQQAAMLAQEYVESVAKIKQVLEQGEIENGIKDLEAMENSMKLLLLSTIADEATHTLQH